MFSFICAWTNARANNLDAGDLTRHRAHYDVTVMIMPVSCFIGCAPNSQIPDCTCSISRNTSFQGWGQFRNWNWNWCQFQFQFQELELKRNWIKGIGIGIGIDKEELKELIQFPFLIVNSFWFFAMFLAESLNQFDLKPFWIQLTRISLHRYIILYDNLSMKWILHGSYWLHL